MRGNSMKYRLALTAAISVAACVCLMPVKQAWAAVVSSLPSPVSVPIPQANLFTAGPEQIAPGITWSSDTSSSVFGWTQGYSFGQNGGWAGSSLTIIGTNSATAPMRIDFATPVAGVGGFVNYVPSSTPAFLSVYAGSSL